jgi:hypothetical protein
MAFFPKYCREEWLSNALRLKVKKNIPRKIKGWREAGVKFVILSPFFAGKTG